MKYNAELNIREFKLNDVEQIVSLFNTTFHDYAGFVPRTTQYWIWSCYKRPDVAADGIKVMTLGEEVVGYIVVGRTGNIWDICYDFKLPEAEKVVSKLLSWAMDYVQKAGIDCIQFNFPISDRTVRKVCKNLNFSISSPEYMFISVLDFPRLVSHTLQNSEGIAKIDCNVAFKLRGLSPSGTTEFGLSINNGNLANLDSSVDPELIIETDTRTLSSIILNSQSVFKFLVSSKIKFYPYSKTRIGIKLLSLLQINSRWFMPRADLG